MTNKDKIIAAFLVSAGLFSAIQAAQYVQGMHKTDKDVLLLTAKSSNILLATGAILGTEGEGTVNPKKS